MTLEEELEELRKVIIPHSERTSTIRGHNYLARLMDEVKREYPNLSEEEAMEVGFTSAQQYMETNRKKVEDAQAALDASENEWDDEEEEDRK